MTKKPISADDRGDHRPFYVAMLDNPDVQQLSHVAFRVLWALKMGLGPAGIGPAYIGWLTDRVSCTKSVAQRALAELEHPKPSGEVGWIVREGNMIWLRNGLRFEPNLTPQNVKHRLFIQRQLRSLGDKPITRAFRAAYAPYFSDVMPDTPTDTVSDTPTDTVSDHIDVDLAVDVAPDVDPAVAMARNTPAPGGAACAGIPKFQEYPAAFEAMWSDYPRDATTHPQREAFKAWNAAKRNGVALTDIHEGVRRMAAHVAAVRTPNDKIPHAVTFIAKERWRESWSIPPTAGEATYRNALGLAKAGARSDSWKLKPANEVFPTAAEGEEPSA